MEISELAQIVAGEYDIDHDAAMDVVRVHLDSLSLIDSDCRTEGGDITQDGADTILGAIAESYAIDAVSTATQNLLDQISDAAQQIREATEERDRLIRAAMKTEIPRAKIATAAGLKVARLHQIRHGQ